MPKVNVEDLINQMESVARDLDDHFDSSDLAKMITDWVVAVEGLADIDPKTDDSVSKVISRAVSNAKVYTL